MEGEIRLRDDKLVFQPRRLEVIEEQVPDRLARSLIGEARFAYPLDELPFDGEVPGLEVHEEPSRAHRRGQAPARWISRQ